MQHPSHFRTVLFDLDGTLIDTAPDLGRCLNLLRQRRDLPELPESDTRPQASHGTQGLLRLGFGISQGDPAFEPLRQEFLALYAIHLTANSPVFPGMGRVLDELEGRGLNWGVVTNKPTRYTEPLLAHHGLLERAITVVCGDTLAYNKPHPAPMFHACRQAGSSPDQCLYVGDARRDVEAATAAGMPSLVARYGYLGPDDAPETWGAAGHIDHPAGLLDWLPAPA